MDFDKVDMTRVAQQVAHKMVVEYGDEAMRFLYTSGKLGAAFARITYNEIRTELEKQK